MFEHQSVPLTADTPSAAPLLQAILEQPNSVRSIEGLVIATLSRISADGTPEITVHLPGLPEHLPARSLCPITPERMGAACAVMFEQGDPQRPIVMGFLHQPQTTVNVQVDGKRQIIEAEREIVLKCGKASLRLTREGRVELRGATVVTHATGLNRIRGASVKLN